MENGISRVAVATQNGAALHALNVFSCFQLGQVIIGRGCSSPCSAATNLWKLGQPGSPTPWRPLRAGSVRSLPLREGAPVKRPPQAKGPACRGQGSLSRARRAGARANGGAGRQVSRRAPLKPRESPAPCPPLPVRPQLPLSWTGQRSQAPGSNLQLRPCDSCEQTLTSRRIDFSKSGLNLDANLY